MCMPNTLLVSTVLDKAKLSYAWLINAEHSHGGMAIAITIAAPALK